jgi:hypothetical protein
MALVRRGHGASWVKASLTLGLALLVGCGTLTMQPPTAHSPFKQVEVEGHTPSLSYRDNELRIGRYQVADVEGTPILPAGMTAYGRLPDQTEWKYQYVIRDGARQLRGECKEEIGEVRYFGLGETTLDVHCRCLTGATVKGDVYVQRGKGKAWLAPGHRFAVFGTHGSAEGKRSRAILGYRFQSGVATGAVDVTKRARVFSSASLPPEQELPLACLYAGLLLHRPNR